MKGAPEMVLRQCTSHLRNGTVTALTGRDVERLRDAASAMAHRGLRGTLPAVVALLTSVFLFLVCGTCNAARTISKCQVSNGTWGIRSTGGD